ncbi:tigger transposable element-derived protein 6-like, partial [Sipha flava]|uniref:Tigger transposable element-derived protein 6-like n=1 Tax=Sipha flava TaxID=143950 RepID=A0A8B8FTK4_9HEMI
IANYAECDIFNADETELFYRVLPDKTMAFKNEICTGEKISKERLTVLLCTNMLGEFERPLFIGKAKRPRAFKKLDINNFPVNWFWNKKAWMTIEIMTEWLMKFDNRMGQNKRKFLLFLDNAAPHPHLKMKNIEIVFFPPNMTSHCQPLDQGVYSLASYLGVVKYFYSETNSCWKFFAERQLEPSVTAFPGLVNFHHEDTVTEVVFPELGTKDTLLDKAVLASFVIHFSFVASLLFHIYILL